MHKTLAAPLPASPNAPAQARLTINLAALTQNWRMLARKSAPAQCAAVIKADAYGLGIEAVVRALHHAGCRHFFVAHLDEAHRAKAALPSEAVDITTFYILNGLIPASDPLKDYAQPKFLPVLGSQEEIVRWRAAFKGKARTAPACLHIDTGMNRLGLPWRTYFDAEANARKLQALVNPDKGAALSIALLLSHFVEAEQPDSSITPVQIGRFQKVLEALPDIPASLCNSSGIFLNPQPHYALVRPGYALYGGNPTPQHDNPMASVATLEADILQLNKLSAGESVGYGATWRATIPSTIATLGIGYADGLPLPPCHGAHGVTQLSAFIKGMACPVVGRISMDLLALDVTHVPPGVLKPGLKAALLNDQQGVDGMAKALGTSGYAVLTSLGPASGKRFARVYMGETEQDGLLD